MAMSAIGIKIKKAYGDHDPGASKFFGAPTVPEKWLDMFSDDVIFFAQIRLSDIAKLDTENKLPHTGYLYLFLDVEMYPYQAMAYYYDGERRYRRLQRRRTAVCTSQQRYAHGV